MHVTAEMRLREKLIQLQRDYQEHAKPIIDQLTKIEACKPRPTLIVCSSCYCPLLPGMACTECGEERDSRNKRNEYTDRR